MRGPVESGQYTGFGYTQQLSDLRIAASIGSVAEAYDNAMAESFVGTLKSELVDGRRFCPRFEAELAIVEYVGWSNDVRLHSKIWREVVPVIVDS